MEHDLVFFKVTKFSKKSDFAISLIFNFSAHMTYQINRNYNSKCDANDQFLISTILWELNEVKAMTFVPLIFFLSLLSITFLEPVEVLTQERKGICFSIKRNC